MKARALVLLIALFCCVKKENSTIIVLEATPINATGCTKYTITEAACLTDLLDSSSALVAYGTDGNCTLCTWVGAFTETNLNGTFFAIKTNMTTCPAAPNYQLTGVNFTTTYTNNTWTIIKYCPSGWGQFTRIAGQFCMKIFQYNQYVSQAAATANCTKLSSVVVGLESDEERIYASDQLLSTATNTTNVTMWLSGMRLSTCWYSPAPTLAACDWSVGFSFTDTWLNALDGYIMADGEPSWRETTLGYTRCLKLSVSSANTTMNSTVSAASCLLEYTNGYGCGYLLT